MKSLKERKGKTKIGPLNFNRNIPILELILTLIKVNKVIKNKKN